MIDLYTYRTANGRKVSIMLEEAGLPYRVQVVDITQGDQHALSFRALNPNGRIPVIVDEDGPGGSPITLFESGAILIYLAEKSGKFLPPDRAGRYRVIQWLMWQMGGVGPIFGQLFHFLNQTPADIAPEARAAGIARFGAETQRLCAVMDARLHEVPFLAGDYSIADMAIYPWMALNRWLEIDLAAFPHLGRWYATLKERPALRRGMDVPRRESMTGDRVADETKTEQAE